MPSLSELARFGQSVWFDFIRRSLITSGELADLVARGVQGVTSNPAIFEKAIAGTADYDPEIRTLAAAGQSAREIYEALAIKDIRLAADVLDNVYRSTNGRDGYVSLEVDPLLARDSVRTVAEATRLFEAVDRPNVMIKIPGTAEGLSAVSAALAAGVNVNVTLIFSIPNYRAVADAHMAGLETLAAAGPTARGGHPVERVASVASFFVSRLDTALEKELAARGAPDLQGKIAVANCKLAYAEFKRITAATRWQALAARGAQVQRVLWASTSTKNPAYPDTLYVDGLIGPETVNTVPPETLRAFMDHGRAAPTLTQGLDTAERQVERLAALGIDLNAVTRRLQEEGVAAFVTPFQALMGSIESKRQRLTA
ncbi:MAG: transaldolase [Desulfobacterales bacterium]|nr:transaldolase [Desulfobacterales bacterium]